MQICDRQTSQLTQFIIICNALHKVRLCDEGAALSVGLASGGLDHDRAHTRLMIRRDRLRVGAGEVHHTFLVAELSGQAVPHARPHIRLLTEVQMLWHEHPVNQARAARGLRAVATGVAAPAVCRVASSRLTSVPPARV
mgnify:CR=1 FL=1